MAFVLAAVGQEGPVKPSPAAPPPPPPPVAVRVVPAGLTNRVPDAATHHSGAVSKWIATNAGAGRTNVPAASGSSGGAGVAGPGHPGLGPALGPGRAGIPGRVPQAAPPGYKPPTPLPPGVLVFDAENKEYAAQPGELTIPLTFLVTNVAAKEVVIHQLRPTCGCTLAEMPAQPWKLAPGDHGEIHLTVDLRGRRGTLGKSVFVDSSEGYKSIYFRVIIPDQPGAMSAGERDRNFQIAAADRQAVFKQDCARCHLEPARGKKGRDLYVAACGICHEAKDRAAVVPDLRALAKPTDRGYWKQAVAKGKVGSLMPAFAQDEGGPLTPAQVDSLVEYLLKAFPSRAASGGGVVPAELPE